MANLAKADLLFFATIGMTTGEAAKALGCARVTVQKWARRFSVTFPNKPSPLRRFHASYKVTPSGCWDWTGANRGNGYGCMMVGGKLVSAHRFSFEAFYWIDPAGFVVCHKCDNPSCVNPHHLFLGSYADNTEDMHRKGRGNPPMGSNHHAACFTQDQISEIRESTKKGVALAKKHGVSGSTISKIKNRKRWQHV